MAWLGIELAQKTKSQRMVSLDLPKSVIYTLSWHPASQWRYLQPIDWLRLLKMSASDVAAEKLSNLD